METHTVVCQECNGTARISTTSGYGRRPCPYCNRGLIQVVTP